MHPTRLKVKKGKGKERPDPPSHKYSYGRLGEPSPHRSTDPAPGREEGLPPHQSSSAAAPPTSSDHPAPEGAQLLHGAQHIFHAITGNTEEDEAARAKKRQEEERNRLPPDAVDLVVEDYAAEEEEQIQARRRGEPGGKKKRVYRQTYISPTPSPQLGPMEVPGAVEGESPKGDGKGDARDLVTSPIAGEKIEVKDTVPREPEEQGAGEHASSEEVRRIRVVEEEAKARMVDGPPSASESEDNPWH